MDQEEILHLLKHAEVFLLASLKFFLSPFEAERYGFGFFRAFVITSAGGISGVLAFTFIGEVLYWIWKKMIRLLIPSRNSHPPKKFTPVRRWAVKIKKRTGIWGLALSTPVFLSIPVGTLITNTFYRTRWKNILILTISVLFWSFLLNYLAQYLELSVILGLREKGQ